jgi:hypothetical protein
MPVVQGRHEDELIRFLQREAPFEFARLRSIARVVDPVAAAGRPDPGTGSHEAWLQLTFGAFGASGSIDSAA